MIEVITTEMEGDLAMKEILIQQGFSIIFPENVMEETARIPSTITKDDLAVRRDMRDVLTFTIDPEDAKDFDDALSFSRLDEGTFELGVHIADVSHYIETDSALDEEAFERATSVYLPDRVVPMLPEKISNELCSLRPHEDKLTYSCVFKMTAKARSKMFGLAEQSFIPTIGLRMRMCKRSLKPIQGFMTRRYCCSMSLPRQCVKKNERRCHQLFIPGSTFQIG